MTLMAIGIDFRSTLAVDTGTAGGPFSRRPAACAGVSPLAEHAVVVMVATRASKGKNAPTVKRMGNLQFG
jgi:hypothetical protein